MKKNMQTRLEINIGFIRITGELQFVFVLFECYREFCVGRLIRVLVNLYIVWLILCQDLVSLHCCSFTYQCSLLLKY